MIFHPQIEWSAEKASVTGQVAHRATLIAKKAKRSGPVKCGPPRPRAASREAAPFTGTRSAAAPASHRPFRRFNVRASTTPIATRDDIYMPKRSDAEQAGAEDHRDTVAVHLLAVVVECAIVEARGDAQRSRWPGDPDVPYLSLEPCGCELLQEALDRRLAAMLAGPAVSTIVEARHRILAERAEQRAVVASVQTPHIPAESQEDESRQQCPPAHCAGCPCERAAPSADSIWGWEDQEKPGRVACENRPMGDEQLIREAWEGLSRGDLRVLRRMLALDARWRAVYDGPWNCEGRSGAKRCGRLRLRGRASAAWSRMPSAPTSATVA